MDDHRGARNVPQKIMSQPGALSGPFDESGDVGHDERRPVAASDLHNPKIWFQRGEGIVRDFGGRAGRCRQQRRFAGIWQASQTHIRNQPQLEPEIALVAGFAQLRDSRRLASRGLEMNIAESATATPGDPECLALFGQVGNDFIAVVVPNHGARWHLDDQPWRGFSGLLPAESLFAILGNEFLVVLEFDQAGDVRRDFEHYIAAAAPIAPVGATLGRVFLAAK